MQAMDPNTRQPLVAHLIELRRRLLTSLLFIVCIFCVMFVYANELYAFFSEPLQRQLPEASSMIATEVASPFLAPFKLSLVLAVFVSIPFVFAQLWLFIKPGLKRKELSVSLPLLLASIVLFYAGIAFAYFVVFPLIFAFFTQAAPDGVAVMTDIGSYLDFVIKLFFAFGLAFEIPIIAILLVLLGITTRVSLANKRPYVFVFCFVMGMLVTPPDILSQFLLAIPMWLLFELGLALTYLIEEQSPPITAE